MKSCQKVKNTCDGFKPATCISYESAVNVDSQYTSNECLTMEDTTQDLYNQLGNLNLSLLGERCLTYVKVGGKNIVKNVLLTHEKEICDLKLKVTALENRQFCDMPIGDCITDFKCLVDPCGVPIVTFGQLIKALITRACLP